MSDSERLNKLLNYLKLSIADLAKALNLANKTRLYNISQGRNGISKDLAKIITDKYTEINFNWLVDGTGQMLKNIASEQPGEYMTKKDMVSMSREVFDILSNLSETVKSQQQLIREFFEKTNSQKIGAGGFEERM